MMAQSSYGSFAIKILPKFILLIALSSTAFSQAWVPEKGEGSFSTSYNYLSSEGHFGSTGGREPEAAALAQNAIFELEYGLTDRLALTFSVPVVTIRYNDQNPSSAFLRQLFDQGKQASAPGFYSHEFLDDSRYHSAIQDLTFDLRYNVAMRPLVITPFVELVIPSHDYAYVGEASPGRNLKEFRFGVNLAKRLTPVFRKAYGETQVGFTIPQSAFNYRTTRVNINSQLAYNVTRRFAVRGVGSWLHTFDGIRSLDQLTSPELFLTHERLLKASYWHAGGGVSYALNSKTEISADYIGFVSGTVSHYGKSVSVGISRSFTLKKNKTVSSPTLSQVARQSGN